MASGERPRSPLIGSAGLIVVQAERHDPTEAPDAVDDQQDRSDQGQHGGQGQGHPDVGAGGGQRRTGAAVVVAVAAAASGRRRDSGSAPRG